MRPVHLGIVGLGTVGGGVVRLLQRRHDEYLDNYGIDVRLVRDRAAALILREGRIAGVKGERAGYPAAAAVVATANRAPCARRNP